MGLAEHSVNKWRVALSEEPGAMALQCLGLHGKGGSGVAQGRTCVPMPRAGLVSPCQGLSPPGQVWVCMPR